MAEDNLGPFLHTFNQNKAYSDSYRIRPVRRVGEVPNVVECMGTSLVSNDRLLLSVLSGVPCLCPFGRQVPQDYAWKFTMATTYYEFYRGSSYVVFWRARRNKLEPHTFPRPPL